MTEISKNRIRKLALLIEVDLNKCDMLHFIHMMDNKQALICDETLLGLVTKNSL